ncbi:actin cytoskeleton-regulatory complex protein sla1-like [Tasmannia lanceolata]|uniref:actin cytoskeleton-regulatory complex protein sla1-like n=1 Tax=Tasmannia lanceolata TaxID=3420 RepID=UPI004063672F
MKGETDVRSAHPECAIADEVDAVESKTGPTTSRFSNTTTGVHHQLMRGWDLRSEKNLHHIHHLSCKDLSRLRIPVAGQSFGSQDEEGTASENPQFGKALYDFTAGGDDELNLTAGEEVEIDYEVDGWFYVKKKRPGTDGKRAGLVPVLYVSSN